MRKVWKPAASAALCLALTACQTAEGGRMIGPVGDASEERSRLRGQTDDYQRTVTEGTAVGALVGAGAGVLIASAGGGSLQDKVLGGLIGAGIGGLGGHIAGTAVAERKQSYVAHEDTLDAAIRQAQARNAKLASMVASARELVRQRRSEAARLGEATASRKRELAASIGEDRSTLSEAITASAREVDHLKSLKSRYSRSSAFEAEIGKAETRKRELVEARQSLTDIRGLVQ